MQRVRRGGVHHAELRADVQRHVRRIALHLRDHAEIRRNHSVRARVVQPLQKRREPLQLIVTRQRIARHMNGCAGGVRQFDGIAQSVRRKIARAGAHAELFSRQIYRVSTEMERHLKALQISRRG